MLRTHRMHLRLFLQGIECPISRCAVSSSVTTTAQITILPTPDLPELRPGTQVVVGYYDPDGAPPVTVSDTGASTPTPVEKTSYSVLFCGYIRSYVEEHAAVGRGAVLQCESDITYLDRFHVYFFDPSHDLMSRQAAFVGASKFVNSVNETPGLGQIIKESFDISAKVDTPGFENTRGIGRSVVGIIERTMGVTKGAKYDVEHPMKQAKAATATLRAANGADGTEAAQKSAAAEKTHGRYAQHEYFSIVNAQTHIAYQIGALPLDFSSYGILTGAVASDIVARLGDQLHGVNTLFTVLRTVVGRLYHAFFSVATPRAVPGTVESVNRAQIQSIRADLLASSSAPATLGDVLGKLLVTGDTRRLLRTAERLLAEPELRAADYRPLLSSNAQKWFDKADTQYQQQLLQSLYETLLGVIEPKLSLRDDAGDFAWDGALTPPERAVAEAYVLQMIELFARYQSTSVTEVAPPRILTTLIVPDLFFTTPPTCNVLFPNQLFGISLNFPAMDRATRMMLYTDLGDVQSQNGEGQSSAAATGIAYYAPSNEWFQASQGQIKFSPSSVLPVLMPHERFTGIVPALRNVSQLDVIFKSMVGRGQTPATERTRAMMRLANFHLLDERYRNTTLSVSGPFNPYACPGLPCAVIDTTDRTIEPRIYQGLLQSVSHDISSTGAGTSYTLTHVRRTTEVDEIFAQIGQQFGLPDNVGAEDLYRPIWYDEQYALANIGQALYVPLLGCGSVQDAVPASVQKDAVSIDVADPSRQTPTYRTHTAVAAALRPYLTLDSVEARTAYVHNYVRRDVADIADLLGPHGLYSWQSAPYVVDAATGCPPGFAPENGTVGDGHPPSIDPAAVLMDKREAARRYQRSTEKGAFR